MRSRSDQRKATSDWMELEKQRGISITSTVLSFEYDGNHINLLDTPGHQVRARGYSSSERVGIGCWLHWR